MTGPADPNSCIRYLLAAVDAMQRGNPVPEGAAAWLSHGVGHWLESKGTLDEALGLKGERGTRELRTQHLTLQRNHHLRKAWALVTTEDVSPWKRSQLLAAEVRTFEARVWPRFRELDSPPESRLRLALYQAYRLQTKITPDGVSNRDLGWCVGVPLSARQLHDIVR